MGTTVKIIYSNAHPPSLKNWVEQMDLYCISNNQKSMIGSAYFIGWLVCMPVISKVGDNYGRRILYLPGHALTLLVYILLFYCKSINYLIFLQFLGGFATGIRLSLGFVYMCEFVTTDKYTIVGTMLFVVEATVIF